MERTFRGFHGKNSEDLAKSLYFLYKEYISSVLYIIVGVVLFLAVLIPQIQLWFQLQKEARELRIANDILKENLQLLSSLQDSQVDQQVQTVGSALPIDKEFASVLNSISAASSKAGIILGDYDFQVGELATHSAEKSISRPSLHINLAINGGVESINSFLNELYRQLPLVEATQITYNTTNSLVVFDFYYKPFLSIQVDYEKPVHRISGKERTTLDTISQWNNESVPIDSNSLL